MTVTTSHNDDCVRVGASPKRRALTVARVASALLVVLALGVDGFSRASAQPTTPILSPMPAELEFRFALSALPASLRGAASVYLLDPRMGYRLARQGTSGLECLVQRTVWEMVDYRDDIYFALCYDAAGAATYLKVIKDAATMRAESISPTALKATISSRYADGTYKAPSKSGLSYMVAPIMRTIGPPDLRVYTMAMPHLMFYAPGVTNEDIGAAPNLADPATLMNPFIDRQGNAEQSYMIQMVGQVEKAKILADEKRLIDDLCAHRDVLCLQHMPH